MMMVHWSMKRDHGLVVLWSRLVCYPYSLLFWRWRVAARYLIKTAERSWCTIHGLCDTTNWPVSMAMLLR
jgi:hypothetical protein